MSKDINVGSYGNLEEGSSTIRNSTHNLKTDLEQGNGYLKNIQKARVFEGPVADYVNSVWDVINNTTQSNISVFEDSANKLDRVNTNYQNTDKKSSNDVGGII